ncbi:lipase [Streptomyces sp. NPDC055692]|uniref:esterase/lipase family protein n=1 Tax=Streptomyces sp. NPDC055692 TaxID=3155683 RepID=UPI00342E3885
MRLVRLPFDLAAGGVGQLSDYFGRTLPWRRTGRDGRTAKGDLPVLLVHGLADRESVCTALRRGLAGVGAGPFITVSYHAFSPDIRAAARVLGEQVELAGARSAGQAVVVIGYSLGGLIARYYVQRLGGDAYVPLVITLGTPHGGTAAALPAPPHPLLRQLRPGSDLLTELAEPAAGCRTRFVAFYSDLDEAVIPATRGRVDHPDLVACKCARARRRTPDPPAAPAGHRPGAVASDRGPAGHVRRRPPIKGPTLVRTGTLAGTGEVSP